MTTRSAARLATTLLATLLLAAATLAAAQASFENAQLGFRLNVPAGWDVNEEGDAQETLVYIMSPAADGGIVVGSGPLEGRDLATYQSGGIMAMAEPGFALVRELPNARQTGVYAATIAGREAVGFTYQADGIVGRFVILVEAGRLYALGSLAEPPGAASIETALQGVLSSFTLTGAGGRAPGAVGADAFVGVFRGDGLTVTIERAADGTYVGTVANANATYPLTAASGPNGLSGRFTSGGDAFAFDLTAAGDTLMFATGTSRFSLRR